MIMIMMSGDNILLVVEESVVLLKAQIKAKGSFTHFTAVLCLTSVTCSPVTADMTVWTTIWYRLWKWSPFQSEWKAVILCTTTDFSCLILF